ncbi:MAG: type 2 lantipeptide synthetase LanM family protein [Myxococcales bacterium]|nr:type 2 lantipeptide synthetase LanM family protein [Myxococcales bacterium]
MLRALTLGERIELCRPGPAPSPIAEAGIEARIERWRLVVAKGEATGFDRRLAWDDLDSARVACALAAEPPAPASPPAWLAMVQRIEHNAARAAASASERASLRDLIAPVLVTAWQTLFEALDPERERGVARVRELLSRAACVDLEAGLADAVLMLCRKTLDAEIEAMGEGVAAFVRAQTSTGLRELFDAYPVLARLVALRVEHWASATKELLLRFVADRPELLLRFGVETSEPPRIDGVRLSLSDPHHHGRTVMILRLEGGRRLVYKPRSVALEAAYYRFLAWGNATGELLPLRLVEVVEREGYGWMEHVEHLPCADEGAVGRFYERAGITLCMLYLLGTNDCHEENLIASGEHPLLVDAETTMHAETREPDEGLCDPTALAMSSVMRVGLLPRWEYRKGQGIHDVSGLGGGQSSELADDDDPGAEPSAAPRFGNVPRLGEVVVSPNDHVDELVRGFEAAYRLLLHHRATLLDPQGPLASFRGSPVRFVHRNTRIYGTILRHSLEPRFLRDGLSRSIELEILGRAYLVAEDDEAGPALFAGERRALERLDIPYFWTDPEGTLFIDGVAVRRGAFEPCFERVLQRLGALGESDLKVQVGMIRGSLFARVARATGAEPSSDPGPQPDARLPFTPRQAIAAAEWIAEELRSQAIEVPGGATWVGLLAEPRSSRIRFEMVGSELYNGRCGIALFLAGLHRVSGDEAARELALRALEPTRRLLARTPHGALVTFAKRLGIGGIVGVGSLLYAFVKAAELLDVPELLDDARRVRELVAAEQIDDDRLLDVTHGAAGALLACLSLHDTGSDPEALRVALRCGEHLLRVAEAGPDDTLRWTTLPGRPALTGYAHGAAGICDALLRLHAATGQERFGHAARAGLRFEHGLYVPEASNWPDLRSVREGKGRPAFMHGWCTGPAGIGLGRLRGLELEGSALAEADLEAAVQGTLRRVWGPRDDLCCGVLGRVELLVEVGRCRDRPRLLEAARTFAAAVVARAERQGRFSLFDELPDGVYNPGLFRGTAGIGYGLLRVAFPDLLPSVLSLA